MHPESTIKLSIPCQRSTGNASNIIGRRTAGFDKKVIICANFDTKYNSTGAFDNASGTCALLTIAEILAHKDLNIGLELIAFNDEEYTAKGAVVYLEKYRNTFPKILSAINLDGIGNRVGVNCITSFETDSNINALIDNLLKNTPVSKELINGIVRIIQYFFMQCSYPGFFIHGFSTDCSDSMG